MGRHRQHKREPPPETAWWKRLRFARFLLTTAERGGEPPPGLRPVTGAFRVGRSASNSGGTVEYPDVVCFIPFMAKMG